MCRMTGLILFGLISDRFIAQALVFAVHLVKLTGRYLVAALLMVLVSRRRRQDISESLLVIQKISGNHVETT